MLLRVLKTAAPLATTGFIINQKSLCASNTSSTLVAQSYQIQPISLSEKVVLITGSSSGIGRAIAWQYASQGSKLILLSRRKEKLEELKNQILTVHPHARIHIIGMSVTDFEQVKLLPMTLPKEFQDVDILVNNAGLVLGVDSVENNDIEKAKIVIDTNVLGTIAMCSVFIPGMKLRGSGHVVNIGSVAGHHAYATGSVYNASKFAINGFTMAARHDLVGTAIRMTSISPGLVSNTEFSNVRFGDDKKAAAVYENIEALRPEDVADNVIYATSRPSHVQIADIIMYCTNQSGPRDVARVGKSLGAN